MDDEGRAAGPGAAAHRAPEGVRGAHTTTGRQHGRLRRRARRGPCGGGRRGWRDRRGCACAGGSRGSWTDGGCSAGRCACSRLLHGVWRAAGQRTEVSGQRSGAPARHPGGADGVTGGPGSDRSTVRARRAPGQTTGALRRDSALGARGRPVLGGADGPPDVLRDEAPDRPPRGGSVRGPTRRRSVEGPAGRAGSTLATVGRTGAGGGGRPGGAWPRPGPGVLPTGVDNSVDRAVRLGRAFVAGLHGPRPGALAAPTGAGRTSGAGAGRGEGA